MDQGHRGVRRAGAGVPGDLARDDPDERSAVGGRDERDLPRPQVLVARRGPLEVARQVHPELDAVEEPAADDERLGGLLDMEDPGARGHPLRVAVRDDAAAAVRVVVLEGAVHHVGHRLEAAMRVPGRALRLARGVLHLAHLVHVDERVEVGEVDAVESAADGEALALEPARGARDGAHGALAGRDRVRVGDPGQDGDVVDGDGGHGRFGPVVGAGAGAPRAVGYIVASATIGVKAPTHVQPASAARRDQGFLLVRASCRVAMEPARPLSPRPASGSRRPGTRRAAGSGRRRAPRR